MRVEVLMATLLVSGCVVDRDRPIDAFSCSAGGPCTSTDQDAGPRPEDAGEVDAGGLPPVCAGAEPLVGDGVVLGNNVDSTNKYDGPCFPAGGRDVVYGFDVPGRLESLSLTLEQADYDTGLHLYRDGCQPVNRIGCNDDDPVTSALNSSLYLEDLPPGRYAAVVDAFFASDTGTYIFNVKGTVAAGEPCDPALEFLECAFGSCGADGRCPIPLDCGDGVDADRDGVTDEDAATCVAPLGLSCRVDGTIAIRSRFELRGEAVGTVASRRWTIESAPTGSVERLSPPAASIAQFIPDIGGTYSFMHVVADQDLQLTACRLDVDPAIPDAFHVELLWNTDETPYENYRNVELHLLHPNATAWYDDTFDCITPFCGSAPAEEWGPGGFEDDPYAIGGSISPIAANILEPEINTTYRIGASYFIDAGQSAALVEARVWCNGVLAAAVGPVALVNGDRSVDENDFWKIADVMWDGVGNCTVTVLGNPPTAPIIVTGAEAQRSR